MNLFLDDINSSKLFDADFEVEARNQQKDELCSYMHVTQKG